MNLHLQSLRFNTAGEHKRKVVHEKYVGQKGDKKKEAWEKEPSIYHVSGIQAQEK